MNKDILFIIVIFALVVFGVYLVFFTKEDISLSILSDLKQSTGIEFSSVEVANFIWNVEDKEGFASPLTIFGKKINAIGISNEEGYRISSYFEDKGFKMDFFNIADGTFVGITGYKKDNNVCVFHRAIQADAEGMPIAADKIDVSISCGELK